MTETESNKTARGSIECVLLAAFGMELGTNPCCKLREIPTPLLQPARGSPSVTPHYG